jgi:hypothetical protein
MSQVITKITSDGQSLIHTGPASVGSVTLVAGVAAIATCQITDAVSAGGGTDIVTNLSALTSDSKTIQFNGVKVTTGVYLEAIAGAGATVIVELI